MREFEREKQQNKSNFKSHHCNKNSIIFQLLTYHNSQYFTRARIEKTREEATTAADSDRENADPTSGDGAGAGELSWAETVAAIEEIAIAIEKTSTITFAMLTCAIAVKKGSSKTNERGRERDFQSR